MHTCLSIVASLGLLAVAAGGDRQVVCGVSAHTCTEAPVNQEEIGLNAEALGSFTPTRVEISIDFRGNSRFLVVARGQLPEDLAVQLRRQGFQQEPNTRRWRKDDILLTTKDQGFEVEVTRGQLIENPPRLDLTSVLANSRFSGLVDFDEGVAWFRLPSMEEVHRALEASPGMWFRPTRPHSYFRVSEYLNHSVSLMRVLDVGDHLLLYLSLERK